MTTPSTPSFNVQEEGMGRRAVPVGGGNMPQPPMVRSLDGSLSQAATALQEISRDSREARMRAERDLRMGGMGTQGGTHGSGLLSEVTSAVAGVAESMKTNVERMFAQAEQRMVNATRRMDAHARPDDWVPGSDTAPATRPRMGPPPPPDYSLPRSPLASSPVSDPTNEAPSSDRVAGGLPQPVIGPQRPPAPGAAPRGAQDPAGLGPDASLSEVKGSFAQQVQVRVGQAIQARADRTLQRAPHLGTLPGETTLRHIDPATGAAGAEATEQEASAFSRATRTASILRNYGGSIVNQQSVRGGIGAALPGTAVRALGVAGAAYTVGNKVLDFAERQRQELQEFRSIQGGEGSVLTDVDAYQERAAMRRFRIGQRLQRGFAGGLGSEEANALFMGATRTGLQGEERQNALELGTENFRKYAMDINQSLELITVSARNGQTGLHGISEALETVTEAAVRSGVNAKVARDNFIASYREAAPVFTGQGTAAAVAGGVAAATAGLGHEYEGVNLGGGITDPMFMRRVAAQQGQSYASVVMDSQGGPGGVEYLRNAEEMRNRTLIGQFSQQAREMIAARIDANEGRRFDPQEILDITREAVERSPNLDPQTMSRVLEQVGVTGVQPNNAIQTAVQSIIGNNSMAAEAERTLGEMSNRTLSDEDRGIVAPVSPARPGNMDLLGDEAEMTDPAYGMLGTADVIAGLDAEEVEQAKPRTPRITKALRDVAEASGGDEGDFQGVGGLFTSQDAKARQAYLGQVKETGKIAPTIQRMLKQGDENQRFVVRASRGKEGGTYDRVVNAYEAIQHFGDQLRRGDVKIAAGQGEGKTLAEEYGGQVDESIDITSDDIVHAGNKVGRSFKNWARENEDEEKKGGGTVLVSPSPELARLLRFSGTGNLRIGETTPPDPHIPSLFRPTGQAPIGGGH